MIENVPVGIKLNTGEEVFASLEAMDEYGNIEISKPHKIHRMFESNNGNIESKLLYEPLMDFCEGNLHINRRNILICEPLKPRLVQLYLDMIVNVTNMVKHDIEPKIAGEEPLTKVKQKPILH